MRKAKRSRSEEIKELRAQLKRRYWENVEENVFIIDAN